MLKKKITVGPTFYTTENKYETTQDGGVINTGGQQAFHSYEAVGLDNSMLDSEALYEHYFGANRKIGQLALANSALTFVLHTIPGGKQVDILADKDRKIDDWKTWKDLAIATADDAATLLTLGGSTLVMKSIGVALKGGVLTWQIVDFANADPKDRAALGGKSC